MPADVNGTGDSNQVGGVNRCPQCGATEIQPRITTGTLICLFCRHEWSEQRVNEAADSATLATLRGTTASAGASNIDTNTNALITLKCGGCGAEVVVNTNEHASARCHWCRHILTIDTQIPNGAVPDAVLPFTVSHHDAVERINAFASKRRIFAHRQFIRDFKADNVVGVYMPYMVVDGTVSGAVDGYGEIETRRYTRGTGKSKTTYYDADVHTVQRQVDFVFDDLTIESSAERANFASTANTNNIINTILPFDTENAVKFNANYLTGFTSERRDRDISDLHPTLEHQLLSITRAQVEASVRGYDRGVRWERERVDVHGTHWVAMYLPVWLYSYYHQSQNNATVHYIAVNGRSGETMGSIPISQPKLLAAAVAIGVGVETAVIALLAAG